MNIFFKTFERKIMDLIGKKIILTDIDRFPEENDLSDLWLGGVYEIVDYVAVEDKIYVKVKDKKNWYRIKHFSYYEF